MNDLISLDARKKASALRKPYLKSSAAFVESFLPPDFVWDGILQRGFLYSATAPTGAGKTAVFLLVAAKLSQGQSIGGRDTQCGSVVFLSGENSDDVRMRWISMADSLGFDPAEMDVYFVEGTFSLTDFGDTVIEQINSLSDCILVVVDTSAAFFEGGEENSNVELGNHARKLRRFTQCSNRPSVVVLCHPAKRAGDDSLLPRGGGAFLAEVDGNLSLKPVTDTTVELHWQGKLRGPGFEPVSFDLVKTTSAKLVDSRNRPQMTVIAKDLTHAEAEAQRVAMVRSDNRVLMAIDDLEEPSMADIAHHLGWISAKGEPQKSSIFKAIKRLESAGMVEKTRSGQYSLTVQGEKEALRVTKKTAPKTPFTGVNGSGPKGTRNDRERKRERT